MPWTSRLLTLYFHATLLTSAVCFLADWADVRIGQIHFTLATSDSMVTPFSCGLCTSYSQHCCPMRIEGCAQSITFCSNLSQLTQCNVTTECVEAWTMQNVGWLIILQITVFWCLLTLVSHFLDRARVDSQHEMAYSSWIDSSS